MGDLLRRSGLVEPRRRRRSALVPASQAVPEAIAPNDRSRRPPGRRCSEVGSSASCGRGSIDFKGWFRTSDGARCDPLTLTDAHSRFILELRVVEPTIAGVEPAVDQVLREHGLPARLRMDNGSPFALAGAGGLTRLSAKWAKLGIALERIEPGKPQQNGRHERMHRMLKAETSRPPAGTVAEQQARFDACREGFNQHRPHEALGQVPPASLWRPSPRPYPDRIEEPLVWRLASRAPRPVNRRDQVARRAHLRQRGACREAGRHR